MKQFTDRTHPSHTRTLDQKLPFTHVRMKRHQLQQHFPPNTPATNNTIFSTTFLLRSHCRINLPKIISTQSKTKIPAKSIGHLLGRHVHVHEWFRNVASNRDHHPLIWHDKRVFYVSANCTLARTFIAYAAKTATKTLSYNHIHLPRHTHSSSACLHLPPLHPSHIVTPQHAASSSSYSLSALSFD